MRLWHNYLLICLLAVVVILGARLFDAAPKNATACKPHSGWQDKLSGSICAEYR